MRCSPAPLVFFFLAACGGSDENGGTGPNVTRVDGNAWQLEAEYGNTQFGVTCSLHGTISFIQSGSHLTGGHIAGQETCSGPDGSGGNVVSQSISSGEITETGSVTFNTPGPCEFAGQFAQDEFGQAIEGDLECSVGVAVTGTFSAQR